MPFDALMPKDPRPHRPNCQCLAVFGQAVAIDGICETCGAWTGSALGVSPLQLKQVILETVKEGLIDEREAMLILDYYGL